jgi:RNA 2',3'-cyclic 3'-phosphodiesterase
MTTRSETTRTFVAIAIPGPLRHKLTELQELLSAEFPGFRWPKESTFHATLVFLGDVRNSDLQTLHGAIILAASQFEPFELRLEGLGAFPTPSRPRVIWSGLVAPNMNPLFDLQAEIVKAVSVAGYPPDDLRFHPHITLGRSNSNRGGPGDFPRVLEHYQTWSAGSFKVEEVMTFRSILGPGGPNYTSCGPN